MHCCLWRVLPDDSAHYIQARQSNTGSQKIWQRFQIDCWVFDYRPQRKAIKFETSKVVLREKSNNQWRIYFHTWQLDIEGSNYSSFQLNWLVPTETSKSVRIWNPWELAKDLNNRWSKTVWKFDKSNKTSWINFEPNFGCTCCSEKKIERHTQIDKSICWAYE